MTKANAITLSNLGREYQGMWKTCQEKTASVAQNIVVRVFKVSTHSGTCPKSTGTMTRVVDVILKNMCHLLHLGNIFVRSSSVVIIAHFFFVFLCALNVRARFRSCARTTCSARATSRASLRRLSGIAHDDTTTIDFAAVV
jgi:hypothetical protein